jgi:hypothetical protein
MAYNDEVCLATFPTPLALLYIYDLVLIADSNLYSLTTLIYYSHYSFCSIRTMTDCQNTTSTGHHGPREWPSFKSGYTTQNVAFDWIVLPKLRHKAIPGRIYYHSITSDNLSTLQRGRVFFPSCILSNQRMGPSFAYFGCDIEMGMLKVTLLCCN